MIIEELKKNNIIKKGVFKLKSGEISDTYIDLKRVVSFPQLHKKLCDQLMQRIRYNYIPLPLSIEANQPEKNNQILICGTPYGAVSYASYISIQTNIPMIFLRKEQKQYGTKNLIEGNYKKNDKVILIEDVTSTGTSVKESAKTLESEGLVVTQIITIFSRATNFNLEYNNIPIEYLYHKNDLNEESPISPISIASSITSCTTSISTTSSSTTSHSTAPPRSISSSLLKVNKRTKPTLQEIIKEKKSKICLAADVNSIYELLNLIEIAGPHICMLKIHSDIIKDFHTNYEYVRQQLVRLKKYYNFKIWEDRKFADIGSIMRKQLTMHISDWADVISVHPIAGQESLNQLNLETSPVSASDQPTQIDIILIAEMSSSGNLMNEEYQQQVVNMAYNTDNVIGIVAQHPIEPNANANANTYANVNANANANTNTNKPLYIVPGISLNKKTDNQGQNYNSPDTKQFADVYVVGRGIYEAEDPLVALEQYKAL